MGRHSYTDNKKGVSRPEALAPETLLEGTRPVGRRSADAVVDATVTGRHRHRLRWVLAITAGVLLAVLVAFAAWALIFINSVNSDLVHSDPLALKALTKVTKSNPVASRAPQPFTMLLLGTDKRGKPGDSRSDTILFARVDPAKKRVWLLSLPRDTRADIPGYGVAKLNKAFTLGGAALTIDTVEKLLGVPVNHYMVVNVNGFKRIVDVLGGVWVDVDSEINDPKAAASNPGHEGQHIRPGYQKLSPAEALVYVRSRDYPDADFTRMRHQQEFFKAVAKQAVTMANFLKLPRLVRETSRFTKSDMTVGELVGVARSLRGINGTALQTATMSGEWRSPFVYTDEQLKADLLSRMMKGRSFEESGAGGVAIPEDVSLTVRNGSGRAGAAAEAGQVLKASGFDIREVGNAKRSNYAQTLVVYSGSPGEARLVIDQLGQGVPIANTGKYEYSTDVLVVVGRDWQSVPSARAEQTQ